MKRLINLIKLIVKTVIPTKAYDIYIRPYMISTNKYVTYNGVKVFRKRWGDYFFPKYSDNSTYEKKYIQKIREHVDENNKVVIIGGGYGVSTVVSARQVGEEGMVVTYEAGCKEYKITKQAVELNGVENIADVEHRIVENKVETRSNTDSAGLISTQELPVPDVLCLDCDGAEVKVLSNLDQNTRPQKLIVEHHASGSKRSGDYVDYQPKLIKQILQTKGYKVIERVEEDNVTFIVAKRT